VYTVICITQLLDLDPQLIVRFVKAKGVKMLCQKLVNISSLELIEHVIRALEKTANEIPRAILVSNGTLHLIQLFEFLDSLQQKNVLQLINTIIKSAKKSEDIENYAIPILKQVSDIINNKESSREVIELITEIILNSCEDIIRICETDNSKLKVLMDYIASDELLKNLLSFLYKVVDNKEITVKSLNNIMKSLKYMCMNSSSANKRIINNSFLNTIWKLLSSKQLRDKGEGVIQLLESILPHKQSNTKEIEAIKKHLIQTQNNLLKTLGQNILPQVMVVYKNTANTIIKINCLQVIDKILFISNYEDTNIIPQFLYEVFNSNESVLTCFAFSITEIIFQRLVKEYLMGMVREGVIDQIRLHKNVDHLNKKYKGNTAYVEYFSGYERPSRHMSLFTGKSNRMELISSLSLRNPITYMQVTATKLLKTYDLLQDKEESKEVQKELESLKKIVERLKTLIRIGTLGTKKEWDKVFTQLANLIPNFTIYQAHNTSLFINLYYALCILPSEYKQRLCYGRVEEFNKDFIRNYSMLHYEDLVQMAIRHKSFIEVLNNTYLCKSKNVLIT